MGTRRRRTVRAASALTFLLLGTAGAGYAVAAPEPDDATRGAPCNSAPPRDIDPAPPDYVDDADAYLRDGTGASCDGIGLQVGEKLDIHCYTVAESNGHTWTYARLSEPGEVAKGWVRDDHLQYGGSSRKCREYD